MSFSTFNGDVDVTLPGDAKATIKARADHGDIFTDFDVKLEARPASRQLRRHRRLLQHLPRHQHRPHHLRLQRLPPELRLRLRAAARQAARGAARATTKRAARSRADDGFVEGSINGGGPEIQFTTFNGRILIHKK